MLDVKYEIVEEDRESQDEILSLTMLRHLMQGIAYFCMVESGKPMSATDMTEFLGLSDSWYTEKFSQAVNELIERGLVKEVR